MDQIALLWILQFPGSRVSGAVNVGRTRNCRLWWPSNVFSLPNSSFLFGCFHPSSDVSFNVVVAFACDEPKLTSLLSDLDLQEFLWGANKNMPVLLQDKSKLSVLGYFLEDFNGNKEFVKCGNDRNRYANSASDHCLV